MEERDAFKEAVFFFDGDELSSEMHYGEFEALLLRAATVAAHAATVVKGAYVVIGSGLAVRGIVCFLLRIDENGYADTEFSVPLRHLVRMAGPGPDVGCGPIRLACRSQCPVAWHAPNLWEPETGIAQNPLQRLQEAVWRNRLGIRIEADVPQPGEYAGGPRAAAAQAPPARAQAPAGPHSAASPASSETPSPERATAGYERRIEELMRKHRLEIEQQQRIYLEQIRSAREEAHRLKAQLQHEQSRNRRLQQWLRGDVGS